ncbi:MAG: DnaD domain protein [Oscillospiraceae bacterium]|nr:DnaD domain protein [Oscillospiraceae bacterium]
MNTDCVMIENGDLRKLLGAANADACLLYIYLKAGNEIGAAESDLNLSPSRVSCAVATLRQLGIIREEKSGPIMSGQRPAYTEQDVLRAGHSFQSLCDEVQRLLGGPITTEDRKILLGFVRYLGLPEEVIAMLVTYCKERNRQRGKLRNPTLYAIEKEAYAWAERGIDTMEEAAAFIQAQNVKNSRMHRLMELLQIRGRALTAAEERYASGWLDMGFDDEALNMAYERTCLNTGGLSWAYMNKILLRWNEAGLKTAEAIRSGDRKPGTAAPAGGRQLDADEQAAIARMLREG